MSRQPGVSESVPRGVVGAGTGRAGMPAPRIKANGRNSASRIRGWPDLGPITKSEPISIVKPEPPVAAGQGSGCPAHITKPLGTQGSARSDVEHGMWRGGVSPLGSGAHTIPGKAVVVGRATAESPGAGCGALIGRADHCT